MGAHPAALHSAERCAVRLDVKARSGAEALSWAIVQWQQAAADLGLPEWAIVRAEVLTPEEFQRDLQDADAGALVALLSRAVERIDEPESVARQLLDQVFADPVTGLPHADTLQSRLGGALADPQRRHSVHAVIYLEVDAFNAWDHPVSDQVHVALAGRLLRSLRPTDTAVRAADGQFGVLLENTPEEGAVAAATRLREVACQPVAIDGGHVALTASVGLAVSQPGRLAEEVLSGAQAALATARERGGDRLEVFSPHEARGRAPDEHAARTAAHDRLAFLLLLQQAAATANESESFEDACAAVLRQACTYLGYPLGRLFLVDRDRPGAFLEPAVLHIARSGSDPHPATVTLDHLPESGEGLAGQVLAVARPVWGSGPVDGELHPALAFPVLVGREPVAVLEFLAVDPGPPSPILMDVLAAVGTQLGRIVERQRANLALQQSELRLREAQELAELGSWRVDLRTGEVSVSTEMYAIFGSDDPPPTLDEFFGRFVHPEDRETLQAEQQRVLASQAVGDLEFRILHPNGDVRWVRGRLSADRDADGNPVALRGTTQDITARKATEAILLRKTRQLADAERVARVGSWERDLVTNQFTWSDELLRQWGLDPDLDREPPSFEEFVASVHAEDALTLVPAIEGVFEADEISADLRLTPPGQHERWIRSRARVLRDSTGTPVRLVGTAQDVTDEKQAEAELRAGEDRFRQILSFTQDGVWIMDADGKTEFVNRSMAEMLGYSPEELLGRAANLFLGEDLLNALVADLERQRETGTTQQVEVTLAGKDGRVRVSLSFTPVFDATGTYTGAVAIANAITDDEPAEPDE
jgi:PAS domain S-box-containing protein/diguanylate cyclase (GGDEF)-like protein